MRRGVEVERRASSRAAREGRPRLRLSVLYGAGVEGSVSWGVEGGGLAESAAGVDVVVGVNDSTAAGEAAPLDTKVRLDRGLY